MTSLDDGWAKGTPEWVKEWSLPVFAFLLGGLAMGLLWYMVDPCSPIHL